MENVASTLQRRRILFLISLPQTPEFENEKEEINECLNELRELQVDVREHINYEDLANANYYDIVIIVAHHDTDNDVLALANGNIKITDLVNSLPTDYKGVIDFSSCYSASVYQAIKNRCPQCKVQAALIEVRLLQRLIMYPSLIEYLNEDPDIDYHEAYKEVSLAYDEFAESKKEGQDEPEMTQLGQQMSSIYSPSEVMRNMPFQILVFFHYDSEKDVVKMKALRWQTNAELREDLEIPIEMKEGEMITVTLSFDSPDNSNIKEKNGEFTKVITIQKVMVVEKFIVTVLPDFKGNGFLANIEIAKDDICFVRCAFNIDVVDHVNKAPAEVIAEIPQHSDDPEDLLTCYSDIFTGRVFGLNNYNAFNKILTKKSLKAEDRLFLARKYLYNHNLCTPQLLSFLQEKEKDLSNLSKIDDKESEISFELIPLLKNYTLKLNKKISSLEWKCLNLKKAKEKNINFDGIVYRFPPIEQEFIDLTSEIKNLDYQIEMLGIFRELRKKIKTECNKDIVDKDIKGEIKDLAADFLLRPHKYHVDQYLYDIFKASGTGSIIHTRSSGPTRPFLALVLAMVEKEYISSDNGKTDWLLNIDKFIDYGECDGSLRTLKSRMNKLVGLLEKKEIIEKIKNYRKTEAGKISITAYYLLKVRVCIT